MRPTIVLLIAAALAGCTKAGNQAAGNAAATPTLALADLAGKWTIQNMAEGSDSVLVTSELNATATMEGWTIVLTGRPPIPQHVVLAGDSVVLHGGPFESVLRPGLMVNTTGTYRLVNGMLEGWTVAHYTTTDADSVATLKSRGMRAP